MAYQYHRLFKELKTEIFRVFESKSDQCVGDIEEARGDKTIEYLSFDNGFEQLIFSKVFGFEISQKFSPKIGCVTEFIEGNEQITKNCLNLLKERTT